MSIVLSGFNGPAFVTWGYHHFIDGEATLGLYVYETDQIPAVVGTRAKRLFDIPYDIKGFYYDRRRWVDEDNIKTRNPGLVGGGTPRTLDGLLNEYWKSGIGNGADCKINRLVRNVDDHEWVWSPEIEHGVYYSYHHDYFFWSDASVNHPLISNFLNEFDYTRDVVILDYAPKGEAPIHATIFRRESDFSALPYRHATNISSFTGNLISVGQRATTHASTGEPIYSNIDNFHKYELYYRSQTNSIYFNQNFAFQVCPYDADTLITGGFSFAEKWMELGAGTGQPLQAAYSRYFPISPPSYISYGPRHYTTVLSWDGTSFTRWTPADNNEPYFHGPDEYIYWVDYDIGMFRFGGFKPDNVFLSAAISALTATIPLVDATALPIKGVLLMESGEKIAYYGIEQNNLINCVRGYLDTIAASYSQYEQIEVQRQGAAIPDGHTLGIGYQTTPRIEYEPRNSSKYMVADEVDVRPISNDKGNGIVYISRRPLQLSHLLLESDKNLIGSELYGPLYFGADYSLLTVTALSANEEPVPNIDITIDQTETPFVGYLNSVGAPYTSKSSQNGKIYSSFSSGGDLNLAGQYATSMVATSGGTMIYVRGDYSDIDLDTIFLFGVLKDDPFIGTVGLCADISATSNASPYPESLGMITLSTVHGYSVNVGTIYADDYFAGGSVTLVSTTGEEYVRDIVYYKNGILYLSASAPAPVGGFLYCFIMAQDWIAWVASQKNGVKKVVYTWDPTALNPNNGSSGAYYPVNPTASSYDGIYTGFYFPYEFPMFDVSDKTNNIGAYWIVLPRTIEFIAYADDPFTGNKIYSNVISIYMDLPGYLKGTAETGSGHVAYGLRLTDSYPGYLASGLGGSTFLTINTPSGATETWPSLVHLATI